MTPPTPDPMLRMTPQKASARMMPADVSADLHPTQSRNKHADVAHMIADLIGVSSAYDSTYDAWLSAANDYDHLDVTIDFLETADRSPSQEVYRLTMERVS